MIWEACGQRSKTEVQLGPVKPDGGCKRRSGRADFRFVRALLERQKHELHSDSGEASCEKQVPLRLLLQ